MTPLPSLPTLALFMSLLVVRTTSCVAQSPPDLSGLWRLDPQASQMIGGPMGEITWAIEHREPHITVVVTVVDSERQTSFAFRCTTDGSPCENELPSIGEVRHSTAVWKGATLVMQTRAETAGGSFEAADRLYASEGGQVLVFERRVWDEKKERRVKQVFRRVPSGG